MFLWHRAATSTIGSNYPKMSLDFGLLQLVEDKFFRQLQVLFLNSFFQNNYRLLRSHTNSMERAHGAITRLPPMVTSYITIAQLQLLMGHLVFFQWSIGVGIERKSCSVLLYNQPVHCTWFLVTGGEIRGRHVPGRFIRGSSRHRGNNQIKLICDLFLQQRNSASICFCFGTGFLSMQLF